MSNEFEKELGIVKPGTVTISPDGDVLAENFEFGDISLLTAQEAARQWAIKKLQEA